MTNLEKFLIALSEDANLKTSYMQDPETAMKDGGLSSKDMLLMLSGNTKAIEKKIGREVNSLNIVIINIVDK